MAKDEAVSQHKRMAMGEAVKTAPGKSVVQKYRVGGGVKVPAILSSAQKKPLPKPTGKIATMRRGGGARGC